MTSFKVLAGLPSYGSMAKSFPVSGYCSHREGFVVQFDSKQFDPWVGNFQAGLTRISNAYEHPDQKHVVVISGGSIYIVDPETQTAKELRGDVYDVIVLNENKLLFNKGTHLSFIGPDGGWSTKRLSWDGIADISVSDNFIHGKSWHFEDTWHDFSVSLTDGSHTGGAYQESAFLPLKG